MKQTETLTIGEWYRENRETIDSWLKTLKLGSFYELPIESKRKIYEFIHRNETNTKTV